MIKFKTKIIDCDECGQYIEVKKYKTKHTTTAEHICAIRFMVDRILENDEKMTIDKLCKLIKSNYKESLKFKEEGEE